MPGPMAGVRVVEMGLWIAGPSCSAILADWGAEVIKIEPHAGDPFRSLEWLYGGDMNPPFELDNRGKQSIALDISTVAGREIVDDLLAGADVFVTNYRPAGLARAGLDYETLHDRHPELIYASVTGYGLEGPDRDRPAYDVGAFWSRGGVAMALTPEGENLPYQRGGMGDHMTGLATAGGVSAALYHRALTGQGQLVSSSLLRIGAYMLGWDHNVTARAGTETVAWSRNGPPNPMINGYRCGDGRWVWLLGLEGDRHWPDVVRALDQEPWLTDPRFATIEARVEHSETLTSLMDEIIGTKTRAQWCEIFDRENVWWSPVQTTAEFREDPQARAAGCWVEVPTLDGTDAEMIATPVDFSETGWSVDTPSPELGQHTELVLMGLGKSWDEIEALRADGAIP